MASPVGDKTTIHRYNWTYGRQYVLQDTKVVLFVVQIGISELTIMDVVNQCGQVSKHDAAIFPLTRYTIFRLKLNLHWGFVA